MEHSQQLYNFISLDPVSTVYTEVTAQLRTILDARGQHQWRLLPPKNDRFHLILSERNTFPHHRMGVLGVHQLVNYYRGASAICRKAALVRTLRGVTGASQLPDWIPASFVICPKEESQVKGQIDQLTALKRKARRRKDEREHFIQAFEEIKDGEGGSAWIAKSSTGAKGEGIFISDDPEAILQYIDTKQELFIVQKYIESPLLLCGQRKFDLRLWVLLDHKYDIHVFKEGVLRTASDPFDMNDLDKVTSHLTNHCLQEEMAENYGKHEEGNEMFFNDFDRFLQVNHDSKLSDVIPQAHKIVKECLLIIKEGLHTEVLPYSSFQLFGFDFVLDSDLKVWLIEVNSAPACAHKLLPTLARSLIMTAIEPLYPSSNEPQESQFIKIT